VDRRVNIAETLCAEKDKNPSCEDLTYSTSVPLLSASSPLPSPLPVSVENGIIFMGGESCIEGTCGIVVAAVSSFSGSMGGAGGLASVGINSGVSHTAYTCTGKRQTIGNRLQFAKRFVASEPTTAPAAKDNTMHSSIITSPRNLAPPWGK
jgi:hypothetical protein